MSTFYNFLFTFYIMFPFIAILIYGFWEAGKIEYNKIDLYFEDLPDEFDNFKILHISDLHSVGFGRLEKKVCAIVRNEFFDITVFTGDFIIRNVSRRRRIVKTVKRILFHICAPAGFFAIRGNHEKNNFMRQLRSGTDIKPLMEKAAEIKKGNTRIWLAGVNRLKPLKNGRGIKSINKALKGIPQNPGEFVILLSHTPDYINLAAERNVNLVLAGDTHGGQIWLPLIGPLRNKAKTGKKYIKGINKVGQTYLFTSRGVGTTGLPIRILCKPEITMITLRKREMAFQQK